MTQKIINYIALKRITREDNSFSNCLAETHYWKRINRSINSFLKVHFGVNVQMFQNKCLRKNSVQIFIKALIILVCNSNSKNFPKFFPCLISETICKWGRKTKYYFVLIDAITSICIKFYSFSHWMKNFSKKYERHCLFN